MSKSKTAQGAEKQSEMKQTIFTGIYTEIHDSFLKIIGRTGLRLDVALSKLRVMV